MATDAIQLYGTAPTGVWFTYFDPTTGNVWNPTLGTPAYEAWQDGHYSQYRVAGTQLGTSNKWTATTPTGIPVPYGMTVRQNVDGTLANDVPLASGTPAVIVSNTIS